MISHLLLPSAVRRATYSRLHLSLPMRTTQMQSAVGVPVTYKRLSRCRTTWPDEASMGETPQRLAKYAPLFSGGGQDRPHSCWFPLYRRIPRGQSFPFYEGVSRILSL